MPKTEKQARARLAQKVKFTGIDDPQTTLAEALDFIEKKHGLKFTLNAVAFQAAGLDDVAAVKVASPKSLPATNATLAKVLEALLARIPSDPKSTYKVNKDGTVEITTK